MTTFVPTLALTISAAIVWAMTALLMGAPSFTLPATENSVVSRVCDGEANWQLVYARTTGRIPANYCPVAR